MTIGLTGGIGSGKSTIAQRIREIGYPVLDTDSEAKRLIVEDNEVRQKMTELLGAEVYDGDSYRSDVAGRLIFGNARLREQVNSVVHPAVARAIERRKDDVLFVECAILFESGFDRLCDKIVAVTAPETVRIERVMKRDKAAEAQVRARMAAQMSDKERAERADVVVCNDGKSGIDHLVKEMMRQLQLPVKK